MNVVLPARSLSLFSGYGGLDLGVQMACGAECVGYVEREAFAAACLVARMAEAKLGQAPVWDDVATFDARPWRGLVDIVVGGSPCQDLSVAGKQAGLDGERSGLWFQMRRVIEECEPRWVFWENVGGAIKKALPTVRAELEGLGYRVGACTVAARDAGAPHERQRLFVLAYRDGDGQQSLGSGWVLDAERAPLGHDADGRGGEALAHADGAELRQQPGRERGARGPGEAILEQLGRHQWPPPRDPAAWAGWAGPQPGVRGSPHGSAESLERADRLRLLGNGVVPQQAAMAFLVCLKRLLEGA